MIYQTILAGCSHCSWELGFRRFCEFFLASFFWHRFSFLSGFVMNLWFAFAVLQCLGGAEPAQLDVVSSGTIWPANLADRGFAPNTNGSLSAPENGLLTTPGSHLLISMLYIEKKTGYVCLYVGVSICMYVGMCVMYAVYFTHVKYVKVCSVGNG